MLGSVGSVGDAYDNALAESFVDSFKTKLVTDRVWQSRSQLELAVVEWISGSTATGCTPRSATSRRSSSRPFTRVARRPPGLAFRARYGGRPRTRLG